MTHEDGRQLVWLVELWIDRAPDDGDGGRYAMVKGEIDLDDDEGDDHCVLNEQRRAYSAPEAAAAIRELSRLVGTYPLSDLLTLRWTDDDFDDDDESSSPVGSVTRTTETIETTAGVIVEIEQLRLDH